MHLSNSGKVAPSSTGLSLPTLPQHRDNEGALLPVCSLCREAAFISSVFSWSRGPSHVWKGSLTHIHSGAHSHRNRIDPGFKTHLSLFPPSCRSEQKRLPSLSWPAKARPLRVASASGPPAFSVIPSNRCLHLAARSRVAGWVLDHIRIQLCICVVI